jgi:hypothetical protein
MFFIEGTLFFQLDWEHTLGDIWIDESDVADSIEYRCKASSICDTAQHAVSAFLESRPSNIPTMPNYTLPPISSMTIDGDVVSFCVEGKQNTICAHEMFTARPYAVIRFFDLSLIKFVSGDIIRYSRPVNKDVLFNGIPSSDSDSDMEVTIEDVDLSEDPSIPPTSPSLEEDQKHDLPIPTFSRPHLTFLPSNHAEYIDLLLPIMTDTYLKSRCINKLQSLSEWHSLLKIAWRAALVKYSKILAADLRKWKLNKDPLLLLNIVIRHMRMPVDVFLPLTKLTNRHKETLVKVEGSSKSWSIPGYESRPTHLPSPPQIFSSQDFQNFSNGDKIAHDAIRLVKSGRRKLASKVLNGHGVAPRSQAVADVLAKMHPNYHLPPLPPDPSLPSSFILNPKACKKKLHRDANNFKGCDVYGWSSNSLKCLINRLPEETEDHLAPFYDLISILGQTHLIPDSVPFILGAGFLTGMHKQEASVNIELMKQGKPPRIRPINSSSELMKSVGSVAVSSNSAKKAMKRLKNQFQGIPHGMDILAHSLTGAYKSRVVISKEDSGNAYNSISRNSIIGGVRQLWRAGAPLYHKYYGVKTPIFFLYTDDQGQECLSVMFSHEGVKQGDPLASLGFACGVEEFLYGPLRRKYSEVISLAASDDLNNIFSCPISNDQDEWEIFYDKLAEFIMDFDKLAKEVNLHRVIEKGQILIPDDAPLPINSTRSNGIALNVTKQGIIACGCPIGSPKFITDYIDTKIDIVKQRAASINRLCQADPQIYLAMLTQGVNAGLDYLMRVVSYKYFDRRLYEFDDFTFSCLLNMLNIEENQLDISRTRRGKLLARLPNYLCGVGLISANKKAPAAYITSLMSSVGNPNFDKYKQELIPDADIAYKKLCTFVKCSHISHKHPLSSALPRKSHSILDNSFAPTLSPHFKTLGL